MSAKCSSGNIPHGYKQTEVGVIPEDWISFELQDACERIAVGLATSVTKYYRSAGVPIIRNLNIKNGFFDGKDILYISSEFAKANMTKVAKAHDVLTVRTGANLGDTCVLPAVFDNCQTFTTLITTPKSGVLSPHFLCLHMSSFLGRKEMAKLQVGGGKVNLNTGDLKHYQLGVPPLPEQQSIAEALSDMDALIESLEQLIAKKRQIKQGAMQELLTGKRRLPGFIGEWEVKKLGDLATIQRGASPRPIDSPVWFDDNSSIGWVRISDVTRTGMFLRETTQRLSSLGVQHSRPVSSGSLIMSICATVGRPVITEIDICIHDGFVVFDSLRIDKGFLYYILKSIEDDWSRHGQTGSQMNLNTGLINQTTITIPPTREEQTSIASILSDMDSEITALEEKLTKARQIKQGMMQELLTGRIRLI